MNATKLCSPITKLIITFTAENEHLVSPVFESSEVYRYSVTDFPDLFIREGGFYCCLFDLQTHICLNLFNKILTV